MNQLLGKSKSSKSAASSKDTTHGHDQKKKQHNEGIRRWAENQNSGGLAPYAIDLDDESPTGTVKDKLYSQLWRNYEIITSESSLYGNEGEDPEIRQLFSFAMQMHMSANDMDFLFGQCTDKVLKQIRTFCGKKSLDDRRELGCLARLVKKAPGMQIVQDADLYQKMVDFKFPGVGANLGMQLDLCPNTKKFIHEKIHSGSGHGHNGQYLSLLRVLSLDDFNSTHMALEEEEKKKQVRYRSKFAILLRDCLFRDEENEWKCCNCGKVNKRHPKFAASQNMATRHLIKDQCTAANFLLEKKMGPIGSSMYHNMWNTQCTQPGCGQLRGTPYPIGMKDAVNKVQLMQPQTMYESEYELYKEVMRWYLHTFA